MKIKFSKGDTNKATEVQKWDCLPIISLFFARVGHLIDFKYIGLIKNTSICNNFT